jgi:hypothetical protein
MDAHRLAPFISAVECISTSSVLAPLLAIDVITGVVALVGSGILSGSLLLGIWCVFGLCVIFTLYAYVYWSINAPDRLQTEQYQLAHRRLLIGDERDPNSPKLIDSLPTANTAVGQ